MSEKVDQSEIREHVLHEDTINTGFHAGPHPQRPIPPDLTDAEKGALVREKRSLNHRDRRGTGVPTASVLVDPERPAKGVLYTGPSAEEEMALRTGRSVDESREIIEAPAKRAEAVQKDQAAARKAKHGTADEKPANEPRRSMATPAKAE